MEMIKEGWADFNIKGFVFRTSLMLFISVLVAIAWVSCNSFDSHTFKYQIIVNAYPYYCNSYTLDGQTLYMVDCKESDRTVYNATNITIVEQNK